MINVFKEELKKELQERYPDVEIRDIETVKINDRKLVGISFVEDAKPAPTIWLNDYLEDFLSGRRMRDIVNEIDMIIEHARSVDEIAPELTGGEIGREHIKENVYPVLIDMAKNEEFLKDHPHRELEGGFAFVYQLRQSDGEGGFMAAYISDSLEPDEEFLYKSAAKNAEHIKPRLCGLDSLIFGHKDNEIDEETISKEPHVLTNDSNQFGSEIIFRKGMFEELSKKFGCGYYVLPVSLHELILMPDTENEDVARLKGMVLSANDVAVEPEDYLSDKIIHFDPDNGLSTF